MTDKENATNLESEASNNYTVMSRPNPDTSYLTPSELLENYPYAKEIGWDEDKIKFLFDEHIVDGNYDDTEEKLTVLGRSFQEVLNFHKEQQED
ncbi:MAG: hypothetical protein Crog4KO_25890 [Crocinitomicaceae bacterium]